MREATRPPTGSGGAPPPALPPGVAADEGPMRRELMRQIEQLEGDIAALGGQIDGFAIVAASPQRGPAVLATAQLEQVRDELIAARARLSGAR